MAAAVRKFARLHALCAQIVKRNTLIECQKHKFSSSALLKNKDDEKTPLAVSQKLDSWLLSYENIVGLTEVKIAQQNVVDAERLFIDVQAERRERQGLLLQIQDRRRVLNTQLDKVSRGDEKYLQLVTEDFEILKEENKVKKELEQFEQREREAFSSLSSHVRDSHEKERSRTERTKYWSIIGSVVGAMIGILGTSINNYLRMRELRGIVSESAEGGAQLGGVVSNLSTTMTKQHNQIQSFIRDLQSLLGNTNNNQSGNNNRIELVSGMVKADVNADQLEAQTKEILDVVKKQDENMEKEMLEIKRILAVSKSSSEEGNVVYVGPEVEHMLENTEKNLEWKMKVNALWTATVVYSAIALTAPVLYKVFGGP